MIWHGAEARGTGRLLPVGSQCARPPRREGRRGAAAKNLTLGGCEGGEAVVRGRRGEKIDDQ